MTVPEETTGSQGIEFYGGYQVYSDTGVDLTLLRENLKRTVTERLERNAQAARFFHELAAGRGHAPSQGNLTREGAMPIILEGVLQQLAAHRVEYVLIGGVAMWALGSSTVTDDLDICYGRSARNLAALAAALAPLEPNLRGAPPGLPFRFDVPTIQAGLNFTLTTTFGDVDVLGEVRGVGWYEQALAQSVEKTVFGLTVRILSLDGLIAAKRAAGRAKDKLHLVELEELKKLRDTSS
jgi:hypothetical protein